MSIFEFIVWLIVLISLMIGTYFAPESFGLIFSLVVVYYFYRASKKIKEKTNDNPGNKNRKSLRG